MSIMSTGDPYNYGRTTSIVGNDGLTVTSDLYANRHYIGINLKNNMDYQNLQAKTFMLENEIHQLRQMIGFIQLNPALEAKFESLKKAGEEYKIIEKLVTGPTGERNGTR